MKKSLLFLIAVLLVAASGCVTDRCVCEPNTSAVTAEEAALAKEIDEAGCALRWSGETDGKSFVTFKKSPEKDFVILNLADTQMTDYEWAPGSVLRQIFIRTVEELVARVKPDLITFTGDLTYPNHLRSYDCTASYLDTLNIPWTVAWGNHDNQNGEDRVREIVARLRRHPYFVYCAGNPEFGNGNFVVKIAEGEKPVSAIFMVDSHNRDLDPILKDPEKPCYSRLRPNQIEWLKEMSGALKTEGFKDGAMLLHIPIYAYRNAFAEAFAGRTTADVVSYEQSLKPETWNEGYKDSIGVMHEAICSYVIEDNVMDALVESDFIKLVLCGHDHTNNFMINYRGIKLAYALKTGAGCYWQPVSNGGTVITIGSEGIKDIHHEFVNVDDLAALIEKK